MIGDEGGPGMMAQRDQTHYADGTPRDWIGWEIRAEDWRTISQLADTWRCSRENVLGVFCRAARWQVWPLGDVLTDPGEFQSWVERIVHAETAPLRRAFARAMCPECGAVMATGAGGLLYCPECAAAGRGER